MAKNICKSKLQQKVGGPQHIQKVGNPQPLWKHLHLKQKGSPHSASTKKNKTKQL
jgi:hypothetical protein